METQYYTPEQEQQILEDSKYDYGRGVYEGYELAMKHLQDIGDARLWPERWMQNQKIELATKDYAQIS